MSEKYMPKSSKHEKAKWLLKHEVMWKNIPLDKKLWTSKDKKIAQEIMTRMREEGLYSDKTNSFDISLIPMFREALLYKGWSR